MAFVTKRKNCKCWMAVWKVCGVNKRKSTGVEIIQKGKSQKQTKREAQEIAARYQEVDKQEIAFEKQVDVLRSIAKGKIAKHMPTVEQYLKTVPLSGKDSTRKNKERSIQRLMLYMGSEASTMRLDCLTDTYLKGFLDAECKRVRTETVAQYKRCLSALFNLAVRERLIFENPMKYAKIEHKGEDKGAYEAFTIEDLHTIYEKAPSPWQEILLVTLNLCGQRVGDIACLKWSSVDFEALRGKGQISIVTAKTGELIERAMIPMVKDCLLRLYQKREYGAEYVFPSIAREYQRHKGSLSTQFVHLLENLGITDNQGKNNDLEGDRHHISTKSFKSFRRYVATSLHVAGFSQSICSHMVGHRSDIVNQLYVAPSKMQEQRCLDAICEPLNEKFSAV